MPVNYSAQDNLSPGLELFGFFSSLHIPDLIFLQVLIHWQGITGRFACTCFSQWLSESCSLISISIDCSAAVPGRVVRIGSEMLGIGQMRRKSKSLVRKTGDGRLGAKTGQERHHVCWALLCAGASNGESSRCQAVNSRGVKGFFPRTGHQC